MAEREGEGRRGREWTERDGKGGGTTKRRETMGEKRHCERLVWKTTVISEGQSASTGGGGGGEALA